MPDSPSTSPWIQLRHQIAQTFNKGELKILCFDLNLDEGELEPGNKIQKIISLITLMERRGRLAELLSTLAAARSHLPWPTLELLQATKNELVYTTTGTPIKRGRDERNRHTMLLKVKNFWIDGVLANSLHSQIIPLDLEHKPDAITRPRLMDIIWQPQNQSPQPLPAGTKLITLFNHDAGDALLILGDPGSGKTIMLLELTRDLLTEAEQDESLRIPVVFNLSTWATQQLPLTEWLTTELQTLYLIPQQTAQTWVQQDDILPLLDGLDEVAPAHRAACIHAINTYRAQRGVPLIVCSRTADYEAIGEKLLFSDALLLKPLTQEQINDYLLSGGSALDTVRHALQHDEILQEMAQSPLLLSVMAITYRDQPLDHFTTTNPDDRRRQLFAAYIQRQLLQRHRDKRENTVTTLHQLSYLAYQMTARDQTMFLVERLQPTWLSMFHQQRCYHWMSRLSLGLGLGVGLGLVSALGVEMTTGLIEGLNAGLVGALVAGLVGLGLGLIGGLVSELDDIKPVEKVSWSWQRMLDRGGIVVPGVWMALLLVVGLGVGLKSRLIDGFVVVLGGGLGGGLGLGLVFLLVDGLGVGLVELKTTPNEGIRNSAQNAIRVGLGVGLAVGLGLGLLTGMIVGMIIGLVDGLGAGFGWGLIVGVGVGSVVGLIGGLIGGVNIGGAAVTQHYILRFLLHHCGYLPIRLVPFLNLAAERLILQKVGGGYRFIHRTIQDHLATLYTPHPS